MQIDIDSDSGFCFGVRKTIELAEKVLTEGETVYCLGDIIHNEEEVERLRSKGLVTVSHADLEKIKDAKVLVRAHGEPPETYRQIAVGKNTLEEGTCPIVQHLQKKVKLAWAEMKKSGGQVVICGKKGHAEVTGLEGQTNFEAIVISNVDDLSKIDFHKPVVMFAQTTQSGEVYENLAEEIRRRMEKAVPGNNPGLVMNDTICRHVSKRGEKLKHFAALHDVIIFVSGKNSSNGKVLFEACKSTNERSYWVNSARDLDKHWFKDVAKVGVCGATSTPQWLMEEIAGYIRGLQMEND